MDGDDVAGDDGDGDGEWERDEEQDGERDGERDAERIYVIFMSQILYVPCKRHGDVYVA